MLEPNERKGTVIGIFHPINRFDSPIASIQTVSRKEKKLNDGKHASGLNDENDHLVRLTVIINNEKMRSDRTSRAEFDRKQDPVFSTCDIVAEVAGPPCHVGERDGVTPAEGMAGKDTPCKSGPFHHPIASNTIARAVPGQYTRSSAVVLQATSLKDRVGRHPSGTLIAVKGRHGITNPVPRTPELHSSSGVS